MITSFEVGAIFDIENRAADTLTAMAEQMQSLAATAKETADAIQSIGSKTFAGLNRSLNNLRENLGSAQRAAGEFGSAMDGIGASAARAAGAAAEEVNGIGAAFDRARAQAEAFRQELARPYAMAQPSMSGPPSRYTYDGDVLDPPERLRVGRTPPTIDGEFEQIFNDRLMIGHGGGSGAGGGITPYGGGGSFGAGPAAGNGIPLQWGSGWGGGGAGGGGGGNAVGPSGSGPGTHAPHLGLGEMIEGATVYEAMHSAMEEDLSIRRTELGLGLPTSGVQEQDVAGKLRDIARQASQGTIFSERQTAAAMPVLAREFGFKGDEGLEKFGGIFPTALRSAEVADMEKLGGLDDTLSANVEYAHMTGRYQPSDLEKGLNTLQAIATATNQSPHGEESILKYSVPIGIAAGIGADPTAIATGFLQQQGFNSSTAGTGLSALILGALDTGGSMNAQHRARVRSAESSLSHALGLTPDQVRSERAERGGTAHQSALQALGITDAGNHLRAVDGQGNLDLGVLEQDIYNYSRSHSHQQTLAELHGAFGTRGERVAAIYTEDGAIGRQQNFRNAIAATPGAVAQQGALADTPMQHFEQGVARSSDLLNTLATAVLPAVNTAFEGFTALAAGLNQHLQSHSGETTGVDIGIGSMMGGQLLNAGRWAASKLGLSRLAAGLGIGAEATGVGTAVGTGIAVGGALDDAFGWGVDSLFGKGTYKRYNDWSNSLVEGAVGYGLSGAHAATTPHTSAIDLINRAHPGMVPTNLAGSGVPAGAVTANSNNTTTQTFNTTVNVAGGADAQATGQTVVGAVMSAIRNHLMTTSGIGEGMTHAGATAGATP